MYDFSLILVFIKKSVKKNECTERLQDENITVPSVQILFCHLQLIFYTFTSVCKFSILFSFHFLRCWQEEFVYQSRVSLVDDHFLYSQHLNVWSIRDELMWRNGMPVTLGCPRVKEKIPKLGCIRNFGNLETQPFFSSTTQVFPIKNKTPEKLSC